MEKIDYKNDTRLNILNIAEKCGIKVIGPVKTGYRYLAYCPFCDDTSGHLYLTVDNGKFYNVYKCQKCNERGSAINLYSKMTGVDNTTAFNELINGNTSDITVRAIKELKSKKIEIKQSKPIAYLDKVYRRLLELLSLSEVHYENLIDRGLDRLTIKKKQYKSLPIDYKIKNNVCNKLSKEFNLDGVPGFFINTYGYWDMYCPKGFLIPIRDLDGRIQGLQIRLDIAQKNKRYKYFSSSGFPEDNPNGTKCDVHVHVAWGRGNNTNIVGVTEGPLKADISAKLSGRTFFAIPGVNSAQTELVDIIKLIRPSMTDIAFDMDMLDNQYVLQALNTLQDNLNKENIVYRLINWEAAYKANKKIKGIDDYLLKIYKSL